MDDEEIEAWWAEREAEEFPRARTQSRPPIAHDEGGSLLQDYYQCGQCGQLLHILTSTCSRCGTCYGCN